MNITKRNSKSYLIVSSAWAGVSEDIVKVFAMVADFHSAEVYHLGGTLHEKEASRLEKLGVGINNLMARLEVAKGDLHWAETEGEENSSQKRIDKLQEQITERETEIVFHQSIEEERVQIMLDHFGEINMVTAPGLHTDRIRDLPGLTLYEDGVTLSKYLYLSAIQTSTQRAAVRPVSTNAADFLKQYGKYSWISAHPVSSVQTKATEGLNNAQKYYTVGSMRHKIAPKHAREFYNIAHMPCAILVLIDTETGEYHAKQMHIDYIKKGFKTVKPCVLDDGLVYFADKVLEVPSSDKATFSTDDHAPHQHAGTLGCFRAMNVLHQPSELINGGDAGEFASVSRHSEGIPGQRENLRLVDDVMAVRRLFDAQCNVKSIKTKTLIDSNHHEWVTQFVDKNQNMKGLVDWPTLSKVYFSDWNIIIRSAGDNKVYRFGDYVVRHGDKESVINGERSFDGGKYLCGHHHSFTSYRRAIGLGCGAGLGPAYVGNGLTAWLSQIASLTKYRDVTGVSPKVVLHNEKNKRSRFAYQGTIYEADHYFI